MPHRHPCTLLHHGWNKHWLIQPVVFHWLNFPNWFIYRVAKHFSLFWWWCNGAGASQNYKLIWIVSLQPWKYMSKAWFLKEKSVKLCQRQICYHFSAICRFLHRPLLRTCPSSCTVFLEEFSYPTSKWKWTGKHNKLGQIPGEFQKAESGNKANTETQIVRWVRTYLQKCI